MVMIHVRHGVSYVRPVCMEVTTKRTRLSKVHGASSDKGTKKGAFMMTSMRLCWQKSGKSPVKMGGHDGAVEQWIRSQGRDDDGWTDARMAKLRWEHWFVKRTSCGGHLIMRVEGRISKFLRRIKLYKMKIVACYTVEEDNWA